MSTHNFIFVNGSHRISSSFLVEELMAEKICEAKHFDTVGDIYLLVEKEALECLDGVVQQPREEIMVRLKDGAFMKAWYYEDA